MRHGVHHDQGAGTLVSGTPRVVSAHALPRVAAQGVSRPTGNAGDGVRR